MDDYDLGLEDDVLEEERTFESVPRTSTRPALTNTNPQPRPAVPSPAVQATTGTANDATERQEAAQREKVRLQNLKNLGTIMIPFDVPTSVRAKIVEELEAYVTTEKLPAWVSSIEQDNLVRGKVDGIIQAYRTQIAEAEAQKKAQQVREAAARNLKAENERKVQTLVAGGLAYADRELWDFDLFDRSEVRTEVERALREEVKADWTVRDVEDLIEEVLDECQHED